MIPKFLLKSQNKIREEIIAQQNPYKNKILK